MEVIETNASRAYFDNIPLGPVGFRVNMLRSASGRAYLAACEGPVRDAILEALRRSDQPGDHFALDAGYVARVLAEVQAQGFALRDPDFGGDFDAGRAQVDDGRDSLGVAIRLGSHVAGTLNITWSRRALKRDQAIERLAGPAVEAAEAIAQALTHRPDRFTK
jgi:IclR family mhp operon transcriptional activator